MVALGLSRHPHHCYLEHHHCYLEHHHCYLEHHHCYLEHHHCYCHLEPHATVDWFKFEKGVCQVYILSPCLFNFYVECVMRNARLDEAQAGIKVAGRNINNLR